MAEAIFKHKVTARGWNGVIEADSCGTGNYHIGSQPDPRTIANAKKNRIPIDHCARQLSNKDLEEFDYVLAMDSSNLKNILHLPGAAAQKSKIHLMRDFDPAYKGAEVPDPYFGGDDGFQDVFEILDHAVEKFLDHLGAEHSLTKNHKV